MNILNKTKKRMAIAAIAATGCLAGIYGFQTSENESRSALTIANIEALSNGESGAKCPNGCKHIGWGWDKILECDCNYDHFSDCSKWGC